MSSTIKIDSQFDLTRGGDGPVSWIQNHCDKCGWTGQKHYAYSDYQHTDAMHERLDHKRRCKA